MKRLIVIILPFFILSLALSQNVNHTGCEFLKRIEFNLIAQEAVYNLDSKGDREKLFFGDFNAPVEFFHEAFYHRGISGFRVVRDSLEKSYILEVKYISNLERIRRFNPGSLPYEIASLSFPISKQFAKKLHETTALFIRNFRGRGIPGGCLGGYTVTFRTVVDYEVWSLWIHLPQGEALRMANLYKQIIEDAQNGQLNEEKYKSVLSTFGGE